MTLTTLAGVLLAVSIVFMLLLRLVTEAVDRINICGVLLFWAAAMVLIFYGAS